MELKELLKTKLVDAKHHGQKAISLPIEDVETLLSMMPGWVKCSDRLPEEGHQVWTYFNEGMAFAIFTEGRFFEGGMFDRQEFNETVTHWMPLPKNPTE